MPLDNDNLFNNTNLKEYLRKIGEFPLLSPEEEKEYAAAAASGDREARDRLIESNLRLVVFYAKKYLHRGMAFADLIQEGNLGLFKAVEGFDIKMNYRFSTYATYWIKQSILYALAAKTRSIYIPTYILDIARDIKKLENSFVQNEQRYPNLDEIAQTLNINKNLIQRVKEQTKDIISLDTVIGDNDDVTVGSFIEDNQLESPIENIYQDQLKIAIQNILTLLSDREKQIIEMRFGLADYSPMTLDEIGHEFNLTKERIRQIENQALKKLQHPACSNKLKSFIETE